MTDSLEAFSLACHTAIDIVGSPEVAATWTSESALAGLSVGGLCAHLYSAIRLFEIALDQPEPSVDSVRVVGVGDFYVLNRVSRPEELQEQFHRDIREHAEDLAGQGVETLTAKLSALVLRLGQVLPTFPMTRLVPVWRIDLGATSLDTYLRTRVVELAVHSDDLAVSAGCRLQLPDAVVDTAVQIFVEMARARAGDLAVLRAFARRERSDAEVLRVF